MVVLSSLLTFVMYFHSSRRSSTSTPAVGSSSINILLTTHYIEEAEQLCDNLALINGGKIIKTGTVNELKKHYKKSTLEDVYLELVGRSELTRSIHGSSPAGSSGDTKAIT